MNYRNVLVPVAKAAVAGIAFSTNIVLSRALGVEDFGVYATAVAIILTISGISANAIDTAALKVAPILLQEASPRAVPVLRAAFLLRVVGVVLSLMVFGSALFVFAEDIFSQSGSNGSLLAASVFAVAGYASLAHVLNYLQAHQRFGPYLLLDTAHVGGKFAVFLLLATAGWLSLEIALWTYAIAACCVALAILGPGIRSTIRLGRSSRQELPVLMSTVKWLAVGHMIGTIQTKLDLVMLGAIAPAEEAALYMAAYNIGMIPELLGMFILVVFYPQIMLLERAGKLHALLRRYFCGVFALSVLACGAAFLVADDLVELLYTDAFSGTSAVLLFLLPASCVFLLVQPIAAAYLDMKSPKVSLCMNAVLLVVNLGGNLLVIPEYGAVGAAAVTLSVRVAVALFVVVWTLDRSARGAAYRSPNDLPGG